MSAKLLQALTDENPELQNQLGCMTGIFQLFDRHNIVSRKHINGHNPKRFLLAHHVNSSSLREGATAFSPQKPSMEKILSKSTNENQRTPVDLSRASFSSSSFSSSLSSLECNKTAQPEPPTCEKIIPLEQSSRNSPRSNHSETESGNNSYVLSYDQPVTCSPSGRESLDSRDVVKDSIYREARVLSVKTMSREESINDVLKYRNSPRPLQLSKSMDGSYAVGTNGKPKLPMDLNESLRVLARLKEVPGNFNVVRQPTRSSCKIKEFSVPEDAPRFSYDGHEIPRLSFDSGDVTKSSMKLRELSRLSLDSREVSMRSSSVHPKPVTPNTALGLTAEQELRSTNRPPSVVAKLMGLEVMPISSITAHEQVSWMKNSSDGNCVFDGNSNDNPLFKSSKASEVRKKSQSSRHLKSSFKDHISPMQRNPDSVMKPITSSRFPIQSAPWRRHNDIPKRKGLNNEQDHARPSASMSVYSEGEKRPKELEFQQSGKDRRALKQILDAMQAKGLLENKRKEDKAPQIQKNCNNKSTAGLCQNRSLANKQNMLSSRLASPSIKGSNTTTKSSESPIVIMKPAKFIDKCTIPPSSVIPLDGHSGARKISVTDSGDSKRSTTHTRTARDLNPKLGLRDPVSPDPSSIDRKGNGGSEDNSSHRARVRSTQISSGPQSLTREINWGSSTKNSGPLSPRLQQKRVEVDKRSRPTIPLADSNKPQRQPLKPKSELGAPGGRNQQKHANLQRYDDRSSEVSSETRNSSNNHGDEISVQSDSSISLGSLLDIEVTSPERSLELNFKSCNKTPFGMTAANLVSSSIQKESLSSLSAEDGLSVELVTIAPEQPSPVSVLDSSFDKDDLICSPVKRKENSFKDVEGQNSDALSGKEDCCHIDLTSEIDRKKLENIERLVQKLRRLNSSHDLVAADHIASLCDNTNPDHRYVSEILLASGLLLKDLSSGLNQIQIHSSGQPINPDLFIVLEQRKTNWHSETDHPGHWGNFQSKPCKKQEKHHRKLLFDTVNELLMKKYTLAGYQPEPWLQPSKLVVVTPSGQRLLRELCSEVDYLQPKSCLELADDDDDGLKSILWEDVMQRLDSWTWNGNSLHKEVSSMVLDIERLIFKDLIDEIMNIGSESLNLISTARPNRRRQQLMLIAPSEPHQLYMHGFSSSSS